MKHTSTRLIFDHWNRQRGGRSAPTRSEIEPAAIRHALGDTFMLAADFIDGIRFRLAGTRVCALFGREIKGERFNALWSEASRAQIANIGNAAVNEAVGAVAGVTGRTEKGAEAELELLLLPIGHDGRARAGSRSWFAGAPGPALLARRRAHRGVGIADTAPCRRHAIRRRGTAISKRRRLAHAAWLSGL